MGGPLLLSTWSAGGYSIPNDSRQMVAFITDPSSLEFVVGAYWWRSDLAWSELRVSSMEGRGAKRWRECHDCFGLRLEDDQTRDM
jgi:hypothetical protein